jgi:hypothetical protein
MFEFQLRKMSTFISQQVSNRISQWEIFNTNDIEVYKLIYHEKISSHPQFFFSHSKNFSECLPKYFLRQKSSPPPQKNKGKFGGKRNHQGIFFSSYCILHWKKNLENISQKFSVLKEKFRWEEKPPIIMICG